MSKKKLVNVQILNKEIAVVCPEEEKADLFAAAAYLDKKMREIRNTSKTMDIDRIAIIAALNISHELLSLRQPSATTASQSTNKENTINPTLTVSGTASPGSANSTLDKNDLFADNSYL